MTEETTREESSEESTEKTESTGRTFPKLLLIAPIILIVLAGQVAGSFFLIKKVVVPRMATPEEAQVVEKNVKKDVRKKAKKKKSKSAKTPPEKIGQIYIIEGIIVNPKGTQGKRFLALALGLELDPLTQLEVAQEIKEKEPMLQDVVTSILSSKDIAELADVSNRNKLRATLLYTIRKRIVRGEIKGLYFTQYILM